MENTMEFKIYKTMNYDKFKFIDSNRDVSKSNVKRLIKSFKEKYLICPILVNEDFEIIDGQNRFTGAQKLGLPIYYFVVPGYGSTQMKRYNVVKAKWDLKTYFKGYLNENRIEYLKLKQFMDRYKIDLNLATILVNGHDSHSYMKESFRNGDFVFKNAERANELAKMYLDYTPFIQKANKNSFVRAFLIVSKNENYRHEKIIKKLTKDRIMINSYPKSSHYIDKLEDLHNKSRKKENVITFSNK